MPTIRFEAKDLYGNILPGTTELYIDYVKQPDIIGGGLVLYNVPVGLRLFHFVYGGDFNCNMCAVAGLVDGGCTVEPTNYNPCQFSVNITQDTTITIKVATIEPPTPTIGCYIGDGVYFVDSCNAMILGNGVPGAERTNYQKNIGYRIYILKTVSDCSSVGGGTATLQYYSGSSWVPWYSVLTSPYNGYAYVSFDVPANTYTYLRIVWDGCTKEFIQYEYPQQQTLTINIYWNSSSPTFFRGYSDKKPGDVVYGETGDDWKNSERAVAEWAIRVTKNYYSGLRSQSGDIIYLYPQVENHDNSGVLFGGLDTNDVLYHKDIKIYPVSTNAQIFNVCWGEGLTSPCGIPPYQPSLTPGATANLITDIANNGSATDIRVILKADGLVIFDNIKYLYPYTFGQLWSTIVPHLIPNKNIDFVMEAYSWDGIQYVPTDTKSLVIPVDATVPEYFLGDYHNLKTGGVIATLEPVQSSFEYGKYPMGNPSDPSYCATAPNKSLDQSKSTFVAALMNIYNVYISGIVTFNWYRDRDNKLLYTSITNIPNPADWGYIKFDWYSVWSWICKLPGAIEEPGTYHVEILSEPYGLSKSIPIDITCSSPVPNFTAI